MASQVRCQRAASAFASAPLTGPGPLAAIDFTDESERALARAKALAANRDAELLLAHASALPAGHAETATTATYAR